MNRLLLYSAILSGFQPIFSMDNSDTAAFKCLVERKPIAKLTSFIAENPKRASLLLEQTDLDGKTKAFVAETIQQHGAYDGGYIARRTMKELSTGMDTDTYPDIKAKIATTPLSKLLIYSTRAKDIGGTTRITQEKAFLLNDHDQKTAHALVEEFKTKNTRQIDVELQCYHDTKALPDEIVRDFTTKNNDDLYITVPLKPLNTLTRMLCYGLGWGCVGAGVGAAVPIVGNGIYNNVKGSLITAAAHVKPHAVNSIKTYINDTLYNSDTLNTVAMERLNETISDGGLSNNEIGRLGARIAVDYAETTYQNLTNESRAVNALLTPLKGHAVEAGISVFRSTVTNPDLWLNASSYAENLDTTTVCNSAVRGFKAGFVGGGIYGLLNRDPVIPPTAIRHIKKPYGQDDPKNSPLFSNTVKGA